MQLYQPNADLKDIHPFVSDESSTSLRKQAIICRAYAHDKQKLCDDYNAFAEFYNENKSSIQSALADNNFMCAAKTEYEDLLLDRNWVEILEQCKRMLKQDTKFCQEQGNAYDWFDEIKPILSTLIQEGLQQQAPESFRTLKIIYNSNDFISAKDLAEKMFRTHLDNWFSSNRSAIEQTEAFFETNSITQKREGSVTVQDLYAARQFARAEITRYKNKALYQETVHFANASSSFFGNNQRTTATSVEQDAVAVTCTQPVTA